MIVKKLNYFLLLLFPALITGCLKNSPPANSNTVNIPQGNFTGNFTLIHKSPKGTLDTAYATIRLALTGTNYTVTGDTTTIQAPSIGTFSADGTVITFADATVTKKTPLNTPKKHLNGPFLYTYSGPNLHIYGASDTLSYDYKLSTF